MTLHSYVCVPGFGRVPFEFLPSGNLNTAVAIACVKNSYKHIQGISLT